MTKPEPDQQTAEGREKVLESTADAFNRHLLTSPGTVLPSNIRLGIAKCAQTAFRCEGCDELPPDACFRKGTRFSKVCGELRHEDPASHEASFPEERCGIAPDTAAILINIIHAIVRHQGRLTSDKVWYDDTIDALRSTGIVKVSDDDVEETALSAAFCEITILASLAHGIHMLLLLNRDIPPLPSWEEFSDASPPEPLNLHFPSFLKRGVRKDGVAFTPYFVAGDVDGNDAEFRRLAPDVREKFLAQIPMASGPFAAVCFAPGDLVMFFDFALSVYMDIGDVPNVAKPLDPSIHCASISRHDLELVALSLAKELKCNY